MPAGSPQVATRTGGDLLVDILRDAGVDTAFGVVSIHNLPLVEAVAEGLRFVPVRHEAAAVNAADGYARSRGGIGCAITSTGTGAGNAAGSLIEALTAGTPLLHVTGQIPTRHLGRGGGFIHETKDQHGMLAAVSKRCLLVDRADAAATVLADAVATARDAPGGPVSVEWPIDLQYADPGGTPGLDGAGRARRVAAATGAPTSSTGAPVAPRSSATAGDRAVRWLDPAAVADAIELLSSARRPVLWIGGGARHAAAAVAALVDRLQPAVLTSNAGRGVVPEDHPLCIGNYATAPAAQALLDDADVLVSVGTHFRSNETRSYQLRLPATHVQIDVDPEALGRVYPVKVGVWSDAAVALSTLADGLTATAVDGDWSRRVTAVRAEVRASQRADLGHQVAVCDAIRAALPRRGIVARDVTIPSSSWGNRLLPIYDPADNLFARGGGIGQGLAMGIGAALGRPGTPVVVMAGDGGVVVHLGELYTLAEQALPVTVVVFNDGGYGVLRNLQRAQGVAPAGVDLLAPRFDLLAASAGLAYWRLDRAEEAAAVLADAVGAQRPALVEVDVDAIGPMAVPFVPPVEAETADDAPA